jgi:hypothetical protein
VELVVDGVVFKKVTDSLEASFDSAQWGGTSFAETHDFISTVIAPMIQGWND